MTLLGPLETLYGIWRHPHLSREDILAFQSTRLRRLVEHAYRHVPYYRRLFDRHGLTPGDIRSVADLSAIPISSKQDLRSLPVEDIVSRDTDPQSLIARTTSGTSGEPFTVRRTWLEARLLQAFRVRLMHDFGLRLTDEVASVILKRPLHPRDRQFPVSLLRSVGLYRHTMLNCLAPADEILRELRQRPPDVLGGFCGVLSHLAQAMDERDRRAIRPRFIALGGDVLTPLMRRQIAEAFRAPVFEMYNSLECASIAWECTETGQLHTCDDSVIVEVLKDGALAQEGERGEVIVTNLHAFAMPFLRYRLGDVVTKGEETCRCGKPFATIRAVQGRMNDYFPLPGGRMVHPFAIVLVLQSDAASWIRAYRLLQDREDRVLLFAVPSIAPTDAQLDRLHTEVSEILGKDVEFQVEFVPELELEKNGKFRVYRSLVGSVYDGIDWDAAPNADAGDRRWHHA